MYEPPLHKQEDAERNRAFIRARPLGLLISHGAQGLLANAIPFTWIDDGSALGLLRAHLARANPQWRDFAGGAEALVVFQGDDSYITPSWYATKAETGRVVPTWNYVMVQARGLAQVHDEPVWLRQQIEQLTDEREAQRAKPWAVGDAPEDYLAQQMRAIVGLEIALTDLRGKWKASQNRNAADRAGVVAGLRAAGDPMAEIVGDVAP